MHSNVVSRRLIVSLAFLLTAAIALRLFDGGNGEQAFAAFAAAKRIMLPLTYLVFAVAVVLPARDPQVTGRPKIPAWLWMPSIGILASLAVEMFQPSPTNTSDLAQGLALFLGFTLIGWFSLGATHWDHRSKLRMIGLFLGGATVSGVFAEQGVIPFLALSVPGFFAALALTLHPGEGRRTLYLCLAVVLGVLMIRGLQPDTSEPVSLAVIGQIVACGAFVALSVLPRVMRPSAVIISAMIGLFAFITFHGPALLAGDLNSQDVTIAQRSFEAAQVSDSLSTSPVGTLIGLGPASTVDLSNSPDASTLAASGRDIAAVDDVHLLTSYLVFKLGLFGIFWLVMLLAAVASVSALALQVHPDQGFRMMLLLFALAGTVNAFPAATDLLTNPLVPMCLGILWSMRSRGTGPQTTVTLRDSPLHVSTPSAH